MTTYRERRLAKAERLRGWSESNAAKAAGEHASAESRASIIPFGQPILVGHHSEGRDRRYRAGIVRSFERSFEASDKAAEQARRADSIESAVENAIYDDDPDAIERLTDKLAALEATREQMKARNAEYRKEHRAELKTMSAYERSQAVPFASYSISNLGGRITQIRQRIERLTRERAATEAGKRVGGRMMLSRFESTCADCGETIEKGTTIVYYRSTREAIHRECPNGGES